MNDSAGRDRPITWRQIHTASWLRLLARNRFDVDPSHRLEAVSCTLQNIVSTLLGGLQNLLFSGTLARTRLLDDPFFVVGHWRSGTTWLFDLLASDGRWAYPTHTDCHYAQHVLLSGRLVEAIGARAGVVARALDKVPLGPNTPAEDEFALMVLGQPSMYHEFVFPNRPPPYPQYLELAHLSPAALRDWEQTFHRFLRILTLRHRKPLLVKSPTHTARLSVLARMFPRARFLYIVRNPFDVVPSMMKVLRHMYQYFGLQTPTFAGLEDHVLDIYRRLFDSLARGRDEVAPERFHELRYEDLVTDPMGQIETAYERLALGGFAEARPRIAAYVESVRGNAPPHRAPLPDGLAERIQRTCAPTFERYGYALDAGS